VILMAAAFSQNALVAVRFPEVRYLTDLHKAMARYFFRGDSDFDSGGSDPFWSRDGKRSFIATKTSS